VIVVICFMVYPLRCTEFSIQYFYASRPVFTRTALPPGKYLKGRVDASHRRRLRRPRARRIAAPPLGKMGAYGRFFASGAGSTPLHPKGRGKSEREAFGLPAWAVFSFDHPPPYSGSPGAGSSHGPHAEQLAWMAYFLSRSRPPVITCSEGLRHNVAIAFDCYQWPVPQPISPCAERATSTPAPAPGTAR